MADSSLTTQRERERIQEIIQAWMDLHLPTSPREQLESVENALLRWKPGGTLWRDFTD